MLVTDDALTAGAAAVIEAFRAGALHNGGAHGVAMDGIARRVFDVNDIGWGFTAPPDVIGESQMKISA